MSINKIDYGIEWFLVIVAMLIVSGFFVGRQNGKHAADRWYDKHVEHPAPLTIGANRKEDFGPAFIVKDHYKLYVAKKPWSFRCITVDADRALVEPNTTNEECRK
jgi:hypothetical protein